MRRKYTIFTRTGASVTTFSRNIHVHCTLYLENTKYIPQDENIQVGTYFTPINQNRFEQPLQVILHIKTVDNIILER